MKRRDGIRILGWSLVVVGVLLAIASPIWAEHETRGRDARWFERELRSVDVYRLERVT